MIPDIVRRDQDGEGVGTRRGPTQKHMLDGRFS